MLLCTSNRCAIQPQGWYNTNCQLTCSTVQWIRRRKRSVKNWYRTWVVILAKMAISEFPAAVAACSSPSVHRSLCFKINEHTCASEYKHPSASWKTVKLICTSLCNIKLTSTVTIRQHHIPILLNKATRVAPTSAFAARPGSAEKFKVIVVCLSKRARLSLSMNQYQCIVPAASKLI